MWGDVPPLVLQAGSGHVWAGLQLRSFTVMPPLSISRRLGRRLGNLPYYPLQVPSAEVRRKQKSLTLSYSKQSDRTLTSLCKTDVNGKLAVELLFQFDRGRLNTPSGSKEKEALLMDQRKDLLDEVIFCRLCSCVVGREGAAAARFASLAVVWPRW